MTYLTTKVGTYKATRYKHSKTQKQVLGYTFRKAVDLIEVLTDQSSQHLIKKYRQKKSPRLKEDILLFTPAGYYAEKRQEKEEPQEQTGLVQVDVDGKTNAKITDWRKYRDYLFKRYSWIAVIGVSCGGQGLFILANTTGWQHYAAHFYALANLLEAEEELVIDRAVSSPNELRYMTLTEDMLWREDAKVFKTKAEKPQSKFEGEALKGNGELVKVPSAVYGKMRRQDVLDYFMANLHNGVERETVLAFIRKNLEKLLDPSSMIAGDMDAIEYLSGDLYGRYADQFGQIQAGGKAKLSSAPGKATVALSDQGFDKKTTHSEMWVVTVRETLAHYRIFCNDFGIFQFIDTHWRQIPRQKMGQFLRDAAIEVGVETTLAAGHKFMDGLLKQLEMDAYDDMIVGKKDKLNFTNGSLDISTGKLLPHSPDDYLFYCLEFAYDPKAKAPKFTDYFNYVLPDKESQRTIFSYLGACFSTTKEEGMLCLVGDGGNGKSVLLDILSGILGPDNVCHMNIDQIAGYNQSADNYRLQLENKIINISSESKFKNIDLSIWKQLASQEPVIAHSFHKNRFEIRNYARTIYAINTIPTVASDEINNGFIRRLLPVYFGVKISDAKRNLNLAQEIISEEAAGVTNLIVEAVRQFREDRKLFRSKGVVEMAQQMEMANDSVQMFLEHFHATPAKLSADSVTLRDLYKKYRFFCEDDLYTQPLGRNKFSQRLQRLNIKVEKAGRGSDSAYRVGVGGFSD